MGGGGVSEGPLEAVSSGGGGGGVRVHLRLFFFWGGEVSEDLLEAVSNGGSE